MVKNKDIVKKVLDIFAIQNYPRDFGYALNHIITDDVIVFENAITRVKIGNRIIKDKLFDIAIFSEQSDVMILVDKYSKLSKEEVFAELDKRGIQYHLVSFLPDKLKKYNQNTPELWFARETHVVQEACNDTIRRTNNLTYEFDRNKQAELSFEFLTNAFTKTSFSRKILFSGLVKLEDKIILITTAHNIEDKHDKVEKILRRKGFVDINSHTV